MDRPFVNQVLDRFRTTLEQLAPHYQNLGPRRRVPADCIWCALLTCKQLFSDKHGGCDVWARWQTPKAPGQALSDAIWADPTCSGCCDTRPNILVLEYLVDFSISAYCIPQAINQAKDGVAPLGPQQKYQMLLAVESELADEIDDIPRDFLKLLDVKAPLKILFFRKRRDQNAVLNRLKWTFEHHAGYTSNEDYLIISLPRPNAKDFMSSIEVFEIRDGAIESYASSLSAGHQADD